MSELFFHVADSWNEGGRPPCILENAGMVDLYPINGGIGPTMILVCLGQFPIFLFPSGITHTPCNEVLQQLVVYTACAKLVVCLLAMWAIVRTYVFLCIDLLTEQETERRIWKNS